MILGPSKVISGSDDDVNQRVDLVLLNPIQPLVRPKPVSDKKL